MNTKTTLILLFTAALLGLIVYLQQQSPAPPPEASGDEAGPELLFPEFAQITDTDDVAIRVTLPGRGVGGGDADVDAASVRFALERRHAQWRQTEPIDYPLNAGTPGQLLQRVINLASRGTVEPTDGGSSVGRDSGLSLAEMRLAPPRAVVEIRKLGDLAGARADAGADVDTASDAASDAGAEVASGAAGVATVSLGRATLGGRAYAMLGDARGGASVAGPVHIVGDGLVNLLKDADVTDWRKTSLTELQARNLVAIDLRRAEGPQVRLEKLEGQWYVMAQAPEVGPPEVQAPEVEASGYESTDTEAGVADREPVEADADKVAELVNKARYAWVNAFVEDRADDGRLLRYGLREPRVTLTLTDADGVAHTLRVGLPADLDGENHFATWSDGDTPSRLVVQLRKTVFEGLPDTPEAMLPDPLPDPQPELKPGSAEEAAGVGATDALDLSDAIDDVPNPPGVAREGDADTGGTETGGPRPADSGADAADGEASRGGDDTVMLKP